MNRFLLIILILFIMINGALILIYFLPRYNFLPIRRSVSPTSCLDLTLGDSTSGCYMAGKGKIGNYLWISGKVKKYQQVSDKVYIYSSVSYTPDELVFQLNNLLTACKLRSKALSSESNCNQLSPSKISSTIKADSDVIFVFYTFPLSKDDPDYDNCHSVTNMFINDFKMNKLTHYKQIQTSSCAPVVDQVFY